ncbi:related to protein [Lichtheimia corymbifera JMRC:FSU:9682]|uniref:Related to protein n=1 Tax=Lichtheimia corymbifera JMRC:FSU:9682 TaxID=1263082 RepID=A0A068RMP9_9FUNG|nr:related to protein [Lichtheimia corymbifera JMRC:FSU:9682]
MREPNISYMSHNRPAICITSGVYDRRALDCTATVPLINSLTHLAYLTSTSPRIREILVSDGGLERLIQILSVFDLPNDRRHLWKWSLAFQCVVNVGVRGTEQIRTRVVQAGAVHVVMRVLENFLQGVENARQQHHRKRDTTALGYPMVLSPTDSRGYSTLFQLPPPADNIANILTAASPFTPPPSRSITTTNNNHVRTSTSISPSSTTLQKKHRIMRVHTMRRSTLPYVKMDPAQRRRNRLVRVPTTELEALRDPRNSSIDNLFYREEDILLSLQLLAYLSKYPHIRNVFHSAYSINVFSLVERFCCHRVHSSPVQYWAGVIMRNACRKDEGRGGIRRCAYMQCGRWEKHQREFAKCRRCRKAKYCSKACQSKAWADGHRWWCIERQDHTNPTTTTTTATTTTTTTTATITAGNATTTTTTTTNGSNTTATAASAATTTAAAATAVAAAAAAIASTAVTPDIQGPTTTTTNNNNDSQVTTHHHHHHHHRHHHHAPPQQQPQQQQSPAMTNPTSTSAAVLAEEDTVQTVMETTTIL